MFVFISRVKETLRDPEGSCGSQKGRLTHEKEQIIAETRQQQLQLEKSIDKANNLYFQVIQEVRDRQITNVLTLSFAYNYPNIDEWSKTLLHKLMIMINFHFEKCEHGTGYRRSIAILCPTEQQNLPYTF